MAFGVGITTLKFKEGAPTLILPEFMMFKRSPSIGAGFVVISGNEGTPMTAPIKKIGLSDGKAGNSVSKTGGSLVQRPSTHAHRPLLRL